MKSCGDCYNWMKSSSCPREATNQQFNQTVPKRQYKKRRHVGMYDAICNSFQITKEHLWKAMKNEV